MARTPVVPAAETAQSLELAKAQITAKVQPILRESFAVVIRTEEDYAKADGMLDRLKAAQKEWTDRVDRVLKPLNAARKEMLDLKNELAKPLETAEESIRRGMQVYRRNEQEEMQRKERLRLQEEDKLRQQAEQKRQQAEAAPTPQIRSRLESVAEKLEQKADVLEYTPPEQPLRVAHSGTRTVLKWRITDSDAVVKGVHERAIPSDVFSIDEKFVTERLRSNPQQVQAWPGFELYEDVIIVKR